MDHLKHYAAGAWAKRLHLASRALMESILRPYDLGSTQWYVLYQLANEGATNQRELLRLLQVEKPTLSEVVGALVRKGLVEQAPDPHDQRQRVVSLTEAGRALWETLPDPIAAIQKAAFEGVDEGELALVAKVLQAATQRLHEQLSKGTDA